MSEDPNTKLLEQYEKIVKQLMVHLSEPDCQCKISDLLISLEFE